MAVALPVPVTRQAAVGPGLPGIFRRRLAVHLEHRATGSADHAPEQVDVVDLHSGRGRLVGLVDPLQDGRYQPLPGAEDAGSIPDVAGRDPANLLGRLRRIARGDVGQRVIADGVGPQPVVVHAAAARWAGRL
jgi:hypothetical protein